MAPPHTSPPTAHKPSLRTTRPSSGGGVSASSAIHTTTSPGARGVHGASAHKPISHAARAARAAGVKTTWFVPPAGRAAAASKMNAAQTRSSSAAIAHKRVTTRRARPTALRGVSAGNGSRSTTSPGARGVHGAITVNPHTCSAGGARHGCWPVARPTRGARCRRQRNEHGSQPAACRHAPPRAARALSAVHTKLTARAPRARAAGLVERAM